MASERDAGANEQAQVRPEQRRGRAEAVAGEDRERPSEPVVDRTFRQRLGGGVDDGRVQDFIRCTAQTTAAEEEARRQRRAPRLGRREQRALEAEKKKRSQTGQTVL